LAKKEVKGGPELGFFLLSMRASAQLQLDLKLSSPMNPQTCWIDRALCTTVRGAHMRIY